MRITLHKAKPLPRTGWIIIHNGPVKVGDQVLAGQITDDESPVQLSPATVIDDPH